MTQSEDFPNIFTFPKCPYSKTKTVIFSESVDDEVDRSLDSQKITFTETVFEQEWDRVAEEKAQLFVDFMRDLLPKGLFDAIADIMAKEG